MQLVTSTCGFPEVPSFQVGRIQGLVAQRQREHSHWQQEEVLEGRWAAPGLLCRKALANTQSVLPSLSDLSSLVEAQVSAAVREAVSCTRRLKVPLFSQSRAVKGRPWTCSIVLRD